MAAEQRENKEDHRKRHGQAGQQQDGLLNYRNMIALVHLEDPECMRRLQEAIFGQLHELFGGDREFQARLDLLKN
jgi:hypothetical protein